MINKAIDTIKKFQNPDGPITGIPIFNPWNFNEEWLFSREDVYEQNKKDSGIEQELDSQIENSKTVKGPKTGYFLSPATNGRYSKLWHAVFYNPKFNRSDIRKDFWSMLPYMKTLVHEKAHSLNRGEETPQTKRLETYGSTDPEDYNVLQEIRWRFGIDPNTTLNDSDIQLLKEYIQNENDPYFTEFLNRFDGNLKEVFNFVADSREKSQKDISYAKHGTKIPLYLQRFNYNK